MPQLLKMFGPMLLLSLVEVIHASKSHFWNFVNHGKMLEAHVLQSLPAEAHTGTIMGVLFVTVFYKSRVTKKPEVFKASKG